MTFATQSRRPYTKDDCMTTSREEQVCFHHFSCPLTFLFCLEHRRFMTFVLRSSLLRTC